MPKFIFSVLALALWASSCCPTCDKGDLGDFPLQVESVNWLSYADGSSRIYRGSDGQIVTGIYTFLEQGQEALLENCEEVGDCGLCCNNFRGNTAFTRLSSGTGNLNWDITLRKDFINQSVNDSLDVYSDQLTLTLNGVITCNVFDVPNTRFNRTVVLNGKTFSEVLACEASNGQLPSQAQGVEAFFFSSDQGVVGWRRSDGVTYALD